MPQSLPNQTILQHIPWSSLTEEDETDLSPTVLDPGSEACEPDLGPLPEGAQVGPFRVVRLLGEGGMGRVYLAEQDHPVTRTVALKVIGRAGIHRQGRLRFAAESQALARMSHPNVAALLESGDTPSGHPWLAMEWIDGQPITTFCDEHRLGLEDRIRLFITVCRGVQHAHFRGILHRDLKPPNVLVRQVEGGTTGEHSVAGAEAKIIDFGIAKSLGHPLVGSTLATGDQLLGTPAYLSPEAAALETDLDTRADVYSLGVLLHVLLLGFRPYDFGGGTVQDRLRRLRDEEPDRPSTRWSALDSEKREKLLETRGYDGATLSRSLQRDLDWILLRALARDREERYPSVHALAEDLVRFLDDQPVEAGPPTGMYLLRKAARRHRGMVLGAGLLFLSLLGGLVARSVEARKAQEARVAAEHALVEAESTSRFLKEFFGHRPGRSWADATIQEVLEHRAERVRSLEFGDPLEQARILCLLAEVHLRAGLLDEGGTLAGESVEILRSRLLAETGDRSRQEAISRQLARSLFALGRAYYDFEDLESASRSLDEGLDLLEVSGGRTATESTAEALALRGEVALKQGDAAEAEARWRASLAVGAAETDLRRPFGVFIMERLARLMEGQERLDEARDLLLDAVELGSQWAGPRHPRTLRTVLRLAEVEARLGERQQASDRLDLIFSVYEEVDDQELLPGRLLHRAQDLRAHLRGEGPLPKPHRPPPRRERPTRSPSPLDPGVLDSF